MSILKVQTEKTLMNDHLRILTVTWKFCIPTIYNFVVIYPWNVQTLWLSNLKTKTAMNAKISVFVISVEAIIYLLLYNLLDCAFNEIMGLVIMKMKMKNRLHWYNKIRPRLHKYTEYEKCFSEVFQFQSI